MSVAAVATIVEVFSSRLRTLEHLLAQGVKHLQEGDEPYLKRRLAGDMHPLGTQVAFTCNQPRNFARWVQGQASSDLDPDVPSMATCLRHIEETTALLASVASGGAALPPSKRLELGGGLYADLSGQQYVDDFLVPNFYFHLVTAYGILRMSGVPLGKRDYMQHLVPLVRQGAS